MITLKPEKVTNLDPVSILAILKILGELGPVAATVIHRLVDIFRDRKPEPLRAVGAGLHVYALELELELERHLQEVVRLAREIHREPRPKGE